MSSIRRVNLFCFTIVLGLTFVVPTCAPKWSVYANQGMVVSTERMASEVGLDILKKGGNVIDAAVATRLR